MRYFFKKHEENFKEWRNAGYQGVPLLGAEFFAKLGWRYKMITKGKAAFYNKV